MTTAAAKQANYGKKDSSYGASHSSFYTTEEKRDSYETLEDTLNAKCSDQLVKQVITDLMQVCADITDALRVSLVTVEGSENDFGDSQLSVDVIADKMLWEAVKKSSVIREGSSEEDPVFAMLKKMVKANSQCAGIHWTGRPLSTTTGQWVP